MDDRRIFLASKVEANEGDGTVLSPVWIVPAEVFSRSMLKRPSYRYSTIIIDAMTGNPVTFLDNAPTWEETTEIPDARILEPAIPRSRAPFFAEKAIDSLRPQGWRAIGKVTSIHVDQEKITIRWRPVILREGIPMDGLTGKPLVGSELLTALFAEATKKRRDGS